MDGTNRENFEMTTATARMRRMIGALSLATVAMAACGGGDTGGTAARDSTADASTSTAGVTPSSDTSDGGGKVDSPCGVSLADVRALVPAAPDVAEADTPEQSRCNFTWNDGGNWGIDVLLALGGRSKIEGTAQYPKDASTLGDGSPYESVSGLGDKAWAAGSAKKVDLGAVDGDDLVAVSVVTDGVAPAGGSTSTGLSSRLLEICTSLANTALASR